MWLMWRTMKASTAAASRCSIRSSSSRCSRAEETRSPRSSSVARPTKSGLTAELGDEVDQPLVSGIAEQAQMELLVRLGVLRQVTGAGAVDDLLGQPAERAEVLRRDLVGDLGHDRRLQQPSDGGDLVQLILVDHRHPEALVGHDDDQVLLGQVEHRLAYRGRRDAERRGQ